MAEGKEKTYRVREGRKFHAVINGERKTITHLDDPIPLTDDQVRAFGDIFEGGNEKASYVADTPDGNPDTTRVVTEGHVDGKVANVTVPPAQAGQGPYVEPNESQVPLEPVSTPIQGGGSSDVSQSSSLQDNDASRPAETPKGAEPPKSDAKPAPADPATANKVDAAPAAATTTTQKS
jgi:hypothetical protein